MRRAELMRRVWTVVLAGGEGERLRPLIETWLGRHVPKQYCTFVGTRSMLEHTLDRAEELSAPEHIVVVMARAHVSFLTRSHRVSTRGRVLLQPENRDTGPGVFLGLLPVHRVDPDAMVVVFPSDHFVYPEETFLRQVRDAVLAAQVLDRVLVLGARPDRLELDYGWVLPGEPLEDRGAGLRARAVERFVEKPPEPEARALQLAGALWNTMVIVGPLRRLWASGHRWLPEVLERIEDIGEALGTTQEQDALEWIYRDMPVANFSRHVLQRAAEELAVAELAATRWSDWGTADRIVASLERFGKRPLFAEAQLRGRGRRIARRAG